jgi:hypothetical protein
LLAPHRYFNSRGINLINTGASTANRKDFLAIVRARAHRPQAGSSGDEYLGGMIPKGGYRFSDKIMLRE